MFRCFLVLSFCFAVLITHAQESTGGDWKQAFIATQADSLKAVYAKHGFAVLRAAPLAMEQSGTLPVLVSLQKQKQYQIVFIGDPSATMQEVKLLNGDAKEVAPQTTLKGNIVTCAYQPQTAGWHTIKPAQGAGSGGYLMLLKKARYVVEDVAMVQ